MGGSAREYSPHPRESPGAPAPSLIASIATFAGARIVGTGISSITALLVIHALGRGAFGAYAIATGIASVLVLASDVGLTSSLARFLAEGTVDRVLARRVAMRKLAFAAIAGGGMLTLAAAAHRGWIGHGRDAADVAPLVAVGAALLLGQAIAGVAYGVLPSVGRVRLLSILAVTQPVIELGGMLAVVWMGWGARGAIVASTIAALLVGVVGLGAMLRATPPSIERRVTGIRAVHRYGGALFGVTVCYALFGQIDQWTIWWVRGSHAVAPYAAMWKLVTLLALPGLALAMIVAPRMAAGDVAARRQLYVRCLGVLAAGYALVVGLVLLVSGPVISIALGSEYRSSAGLLLALSWFAVLLGVGPHATMAANYLGAAPRRLRIAAIALAANAVADVALVPGLGGYGAAIGTSIAYTWFVGAHVVLVLRLLDGPADARSVVRSLRSALTSRRRLADELRELATEGADARGTAAPRIRALHVCDYAAPYASAFIAQLRLLDAELVRRDGSRIAIAIPESALARPWVGELQRDGMDVYPLPAPAADRPLAAMPDIARLIVRTGCEILHCHFDAYDLAASSAVGFLVRRGIVARPRLVWHYRTALEEPVSERGPLRRLKDHLKFARAGRRVDRCVGITERMAHEIVARGFPAERAVAIDAGCDLECFRRDDDRRAAARSALGLGGDDVLVLHMGWHWHRKGGDILVAAARILTEDVGDHPTLVFASVGAPDDAVAAPVAVWEPTQDVADLHRAADVFVSAARSEAWGNATVEALACERVAVVTDAPGQREVFGGLDGCVIVPPDDSDALVDGLRRLLARRDHWEALGRDNRRRVTERYDMRRWASQMADLYDQLAAPDSTADRVVDVSLEAAV